MPQGVCVFDDNDDKPRPFAELDNATKAKALEVNRDYDVEHVDWWQYTFEDAARMGECIGITIYQRTSTSARTGQVRDDGPDIRFSGFWSQGDGASFTGAYKPKADALSALAAEAPQDEKLKRIAEILQMCALTAQLEHGTDFFVVVTCSSNHYSHSGVMTAELSWDDSLGPCTADINEIESALRSFADWIYGQLESEHEYLTSDEHLAEVFTDSGRLFDADGRMI